MNAVAGINFHLLLSLFQAEILEEAIRYIDSLHQQLVQTIQSQSNSSSSSRVEGEVPDPQGGGGGADNGQDESTLDENKNSRRMSSGNNPHPATGLGNNQF